MRQEATTCRLTTSLTVRREVADSVADTQFRKAAGLRVRGLRKQHGLSLKELAERIGVSSDVLNKYECGVNLPPPDTFVQLSEVLDTTTDFLLTGDRPESKPLHNVRLLERFQELESAPVEDREAVIRLVDAVIIKARVSRPIGRKSR